MTSQQEVPKLLQWPPVPVVFPNSELSIQLWSSQGHNWKITLSKAKLYAQRHRNITRGADIAHFFVIWDTFCMHFTLQPEELGTARWELLLPSIRMVWFCLFWCHSGISPSSTWVTWPRRGPGQQQEGKDFVPCLPLNWQLTSSFCFHTKGYLVILYSITMSLVFP